MVFYFVFEIRNMELSWLTVFDGDFSRNGNLFSKTTLCSHLLRVVDLSTQGPKTPSGPTRWFWNRRTQEGLISTKFCDYSSFYFLFEMTTINYKESKDNGKF